MGRITEATLRPISDVHAAILDGGWDGELASLGHALSIRRKKLYRPGTKVRLVGTRNPSIDGAEGVVIRPNAKTIQVGVGAKGQFGYEQEYNVPTTMLEVLA